MPSPQGTTSSCAYQPPFGFVGRAVQIIAPPLPGPRSTSPQIISFALTFTVCTPKVPRGLEDDMTLHVNPIVGSLAVAGALAASFTWVGAQQGGATVAIDPDDIGGVVTSSKGPEAGVWVIAETSDLPTKFARMVVTDDQGRYVLPDLPRASYQVFVRGYGLVDSPRVAAKPGQPLNLQAVVAPD